MIEKEERDSIKPSELPSWLISHGIITFTTEECAHLLGANLIEVPNKLVYLRKNHKIVALARGLWAVVPEEDRLMGAPEPIRYMDSMMDFYQREYCVGWLTAAALHGVSHQAPQVFQVAVDKMLRDKKIGRSKLEFYHRSYIYQLTKQRMTLSSGSVIVPTVGATMLMVCADLLLSGGIDNVATIIGELVEADKNYMNDVLTNASLFSVSSKRRLGWILENSIGERNLQKLEKICDDGTSPSYLSPYSPHSGPIDLKWNLIINRNVEPDFFKDGI